MLTSMFSGCPLTVCEKHIMDEEGETELASTDREGCFTPTTRQQPVRSSETEAPAAS